MRNDLYGEPLPIQYVVEATRQPELFGPLGTTTSAWMRAAQDWAEKHGLNIVQWHVNQRFSVAHYGDGMRRDVWYDVDWTGASWIVHSSEKSI